MLVAVLLTVGSAVGHEVNPLTEGSLKDDRNDTDSPHDRRFFLKQIFEKYGDNGFITFEVSLLPNFQHRGNWTYSVDVSQSAFGDKTAMTE
jgi:hypothetical protein